MPRSIILYAHDNSKPLPTNHDYSSVFVDSEFGFTNVRIRGAYVEGNVADALARATPRQDEVVLNSISAQP